MVCRIAACADANAGADHRWRVGNGCRSPGCEPRRVRFRTLRDALSKPHDTTSRPDGAFMLPWPRKHKLAPAAPGRQHDRTMLPLACPVPPADLRLRSEGVAHITYPARSVKCFVRYRLAGRPPSLSHTKTRRGWRVWLVRSVDFARRVGRVWIRGFSQRRRGAEGQRLRRSRLPVSSMHYTQRRENRPLRGFDPLRAPRFSSSAPLREIPFATVQPT